MKRLCLIGTFLSFCTLASAQIPRHNLDLSDPAILADEATGLYYMTGTYGRLWSSPDLELWTPCSDFPYELDNAAWMGEKPEIWAAELHKRDGKYYNFATMINWTKTIDSKNTPRRAVHITVSDNPEGPYRLIENGTSEYTPADKCTLDASLFEDKDGNRYLIYCHEWVQNDNGTIEYIQLSDDMSQTIGEGHIMMRAYDANWKTGPVTDGPFMFYTATGRLGMLWTSWHYDRYVQGVAYSTTGKIEGPWEQQEIPIAPDNHGHGMLFRTFDGRLLMSIHENRVVDYGRQLFRRHPVLYIMDDSGDQLRTVMEYKPVIDLENPSEVMVDNPCFHYGTPGWVNNTGAMNCGIANNQSGAIEGNFYESRDSESFIGEIMQEKTGMPNGTYLIKIAAFRSQPLDDEEGEGAVEIFCNDVAEPVISEDPQYYSVVVNVKDGVLRFGLRSNRKAFKWMGLDNVSIKYYGEKEYTKEDIETVTEPDNRVYFYNRKSGLFLNAGSWWGTFSVLAEHPLDFLITEYEPNRYAIDTRITNGINDHYASNNIYLDGPMSLFNIEPLDDNAYTIKCDGFDYWGVSADGPWLDISIKERDDPAAAWELLTYQDLTERMLKGTEENPSDATFMIQCPGFGRNDERIANWKGNYNWQGPETNRILTTPTTKFDIYQEIEGVPDGCYRLTMQGFSRADSRFVSLYANNESVPLFSADNLKENEKLPTDVETAVDAFNNGKYVNTLELNVEGGRLRLGVKSNPGSWFASSNISYIDNFELYYLGAERNGLEAIRENEKISRQGIYDLSGRKYDNLDLLAPGLYIVNGRKYLKR